MKRNRITPKERRRLPEEIKPLFLYSSPKKKKKGLEAFMNRINPNSKQGKRRPKPQTKIVDTGLRI